MIPGQMVAVEPAPTLRDAAALHSRLLRAEVVSTRTEVTAALARLRKAIDDGRPVNGLRTALEAAQGKLDEAAGILQRTEEEHFRGEKG